MELSSTDCTKGAFTLGPLFREINMPGSTPQGRLLRSGSKCQQMTSATDLRRIVEETLAENPVAAPFLPGNFVKAAHPAGFFRQREIPMDGGAIAFDHR